jgi:peptidoglycan/LPS O-acetylase OafA/YrhL
MTPGSLAATRADAAKPEAGEELVFAFADSRATSKTQILPIVELPRFYRPELDALRFFAFLGVYAYHFWGHPPTFPTFFVKLLLPGFVVKVSQAGEFGVDLFFLLSAYLITEVLLREKESRGSLNVGNFYIRRILRIWPLYFAFLAVSLIPVLNPGHTLTWKHMAMFLLLSGNWSVILLGWPYHSMASPLWSVSVEEQFYLGWAPLVGRLSRRMIVWAAVGMLCVANLTRVVIVLAWPHASKDAIRTNTFARLDPIAVGILLAVLLNGRIPLLRAWQRVALLATGTGILIAVGTWCNTLVPRSVSGRLDLPEFPAVTLGCALIFLSVLGIKTRLPQWLVYLGKISYGLYVVHILGAFLADAVLVMPGGLRRAALRHLLSMAFTIGMASLSYHFLETPFLRRKNRFANVPSRPV